MNLSEAVHSFTGKKILILGDVMVDRYIDGDVHRISPEAPVPVVNFNTQDDRLGGAANVALNIKALGAEPILVSIIGDDAEGDVFNTRLSVNNISTDGIIKVSGRMTTLKTRIMCKHQHLVRLDREQTDDISKEVQLQLLDRIESLKHEVSVIILQDYNKGVLTSSLIRKVIKFANNNGIQTVVDPKYNNFFAYKGVTLCKPNLKEANKNLGIKINPENIDSLNSASLQLKQRLENKYTLITLSEYGAYWNDESASGLIPAHERDIADVCGAGDTVISVVSLALACGLPLKDITYLSNLAGGQVCEHPGVVPVNKSELLQDLV